jgi:spermidine synthase
MKNHALVYVIVSISGMAVLAIEILGTRVLGPFYGVSLFLWSALITVTLAALSVGYVLGGRWADRSPSCRNLALILGGAGLWLLAVPWLKPVLLALLAPVGLRGAVLIAATVLFFAPLALLGMVGPFAIRLRAEDLRVVGRTAGDIYAVSTIASVASALLTGFVLLPAVGVGKLILLVGVLLLCGAGLAVAARRPSARSGAAGLAIVAALLTAAGMAPLERPRPEEGLMEIRQSPYGEIRVVEWDGRRILLIDGAMHSMVEVESGRSLFPYAVVLDLAKELFRGAGSVCVVGLGAGSVAKAYDEEGWSVDAVEIDPAVIAVARERFGLGPRDARVIAMDGRRHFVTSETRYDLVILDAFGSSSIPFHLVTREAFALIEKRLKPGGVLAVNVESHGWRHTIVRSLAATLRESFDHVVALPMAEPPTAFGNVVLLASDRSLELDDEALGRPLDFIADAYWHWAVVERNHAWDNRFEPEGRGVPILTDERNPIDLWSDALNLEARKFLHAEPPWRHLAY